jgi:hypothetical protein
MPSLLRQPLGPTFTARSGTEARRGDAGRRVVEAYEAMLRRTVGGPVANSGAGRRMSRGSPLFRLC